GALVRSFAPGHGASGWAAGRAPTRSPDCNNRHQSGTNIADAAGVAWRRPAPPPPRPFATRTGAIRMHASHRFSRAPIVGALLALGLLLVGVAPSLAAPNLRAGAVYSLTNDATANAVAV